jgi:hypothetical protein
MDICTYLKEWENDLGNVSLHNPNLRGGQAETR